MSKIRRSESERRRRQAREECNRQAHLGRTEDYEAGAQRLDCCVVQAREGAWAHRS
jgi:hypothetical protein